MRGIHPDLQDDLNDVVCVFKMASRLYKIEDILPELGKYLPFDMILKFSKIMDYGIEDIEGLYNVSGFNEWYESQFGETVEEAS